MTYNGTIYVDSVTPGIVTDRYDCTNLTGPQFCLNAEFSCFDRTKVLADFGGSLIPISLFNGKKVGDKVSLLIGINQYNVTCCRSLYDADFEVMLYRLSTGLYHYNYNSPLKRSIQLYMAYKAHVDYAKSIDKRPRYD